MRLQALGDSAVVFSLGNEADRTVARRVRAIASRLRCKPLSGMSEVFAAFGNVALFFEAGVTPPPTEVLAVAVAEADAGPAAVARPHVEEIPVVYGGESGPDLPEVAAAAGLSPAAAAELHAGGEYFVRAIGFAPGFPYLGGLPPALARPRRETPRVRVPAGSVGIGGTQTGIYPQASPGGWKLIGRSPRRLFDPRDKPPARLEIGDEVRFVAVAEADFSSPTERVPEPRGPGIWVRRAGALTTVQDLGRPGWRASGISPAGAADPFSLRIANLLVGNAEGEPALELTQTGPELEFPAGAVVAVAGAPIDGLQWGRPVYLSAGARLRLGAARGGLRTYLACAGGFGLPEVLGGGGTDLRAGFGGSGGRALRAGDWLPLRSMEPPRCPARWHLDPRWRPTVEAAVELRVLLGPAAADLPSWTERAFTVGARSDRMGLRLEGEAFARPPPGDLDSFPVIPGTVQLPPDGRPIVLLADAQTLGGYARLGHVISADLPRLGQLRPGDQLRFREVGIEEARVRVAARERRLRELRLGLEGCRC
ncbi:MAG: 5-oxoprolinase subunit PxpB [Verrucomicrobia bacterium]|nr:5-oxoprolinase subunit PxpB [Verrucomicrobiota bacterium]